MVRPVGSGIEAQHARRPSVVPVKQQQLDAGGAAREQAKIDATLNGRGAKR
jgi:hypothetical protein